MNGSDQTASTLWYILAIVFVASGLFARRLPMNAVLRMALLWLAIFAGLFGLFRLAESRGWFAGARFADSGVTETDGSPASLPSAQASARSIRIPVAADGHYWVEATINGTPARFLIDSGATMTALSEQTARATGLTIDPIAPGIVMTTANGSIEAKRSSIASLVVGPVRATDLPVVVSPAFGDVNVVGMNLLSRLKSWGVRDGAMELTP